MKMKNSLFVICVLYKRRP